MKTIRTLTALALFGVLGCKKEEPVAAAPAVDAGMAVAPKPKLDRVTRADFNRLAVELNLPLFWTADANEDGTLAPSELATVWTVDPQARNEQWVKDGEFTQDFQAAYEQIVKRGQKGPTEAGLDEKEMARRKAVREELAQGRPTLVATDLSSAPEAERKLVEKIVSAAEVIERLYRKQMGTQGLAADLPDDTASRALFFRNQGYKCAAPKTQDDPACSALPSPPDGKVSGLYPASLLKEEKFCETLAKGDKSLIDPFTVVREQEGKLVAVPYTQEYQDEMQQVSKLLAQAAETLPEDEAPFKAYLEAASQAFLDNNWVQADEAWAKMNVNNSRWYLRIAPDEVYAEPCSVKALFHVSFGRINKDSLKLQSMLEPLKADMEKAIAAEAGRPYKARDVTFHLPDFVDIVLNAGDSRDPSGATIGQSLPNFGPVANEGRGRTVAMTNFYTDPDSMASARATAESLLCSEMMEKYTAEPEPQLRSIVLHEAAHNLGPSHQYKVKGKIDRQVFGGPLASTLEEFKAQTAALYFTDWLVEKKQLTQEEADRTHLRDLLWAFGHISRGMYTDDGHPKNYSQLAAIQVGRLMKAGAVSWHGDQAAANGKDQGCFTMDFEKMPKAVKALMKDAAGIKARGDRKQAEKLISQFVDVDGEEKALRQVITDRVLRSPKSSFVYSIRFGS